MMLSHLLMILEDVPENFLRDSGQSRLWVSLEMFDQVGPKKLRMTIGSLVANQQSTAGAS